MDDILVFQSTNGRIMFFEPEEELSNGFIKAKQYLNSKFLETGTFSEYIFSKELVRLPNEEERNYYNSLKDHSIHLIGKQ